MKLPLFSIIAATLLTLASCTHSVSDPRLSDQLPPIYPDYVAVTIPPRIAPLNFSPLPTDSIDRIDVTVIGSRSQTTLHVNGRTCADFPLRKWHRLLADNVGDSLLFTVAMRSQTDGTWTQYRPFPIYITPDTIDYGLVYRRIAPGYEVYSQMGIYERDLSNFTEHPVIVNTLVPGMCLNCHAFRQTEPDHFSLHVRGSNGGTLLQINGRREMLDTKTDSTLSACVYPYWHPSGDYIAYSLNTTRQSFHVVPDERIEVFDLASDVVVYQPQTHTLLHTPLLAQDSILETFPAFSPDGRTLYFCAAQLRPIPSGYQDIRYDLLSIPFNPDTGTFGTEIDTLVYVSAPADSVLIRLKSDENKSQLSHTPMSISFPRPSYDSRYLIYTLSRYGNFSIWHREADLYLLDLQTRQVRCIDEINSPDTESYHSWSSNSRWLVFSSRRENGLHTRLYLTHLQPDGTFTKPLLLPQQDPYNYYDRLPDSYNVPEFLNCPIPIGHRRAERRIISPRRTKVTITTNH